MEAGWDLRESLYKQEKGKEGKKKLKWLVGEFEFQHLDFISRWIYVIVSLKFINISDWFCAMYLE